MSEEHKQRFMAYDLFKLFDFVFIIGNVCIFGYFQDIQCYLQLLQCLSGAWTLLLLMLLLWLSSSTTIFLVIGGSTTTSSAGYYNGVIS